ncbi:MAG: nucleotide exchange factor GrpE, partial [Patescibacteria group bacterium]
MPEKEDKKTPKKDDNKKLKEERDEYLEGWQRAKADLSNYKKDEFKRLEEVARFANTEVLMDLVRVVDSFELGLSALEKTGPVEKGVYLIKSQLEEAMRKHGLERIGVKEGDKFDPSIH